MVAPAVGSVVLVRFPFSDLSASKLRPAVVLAGVDRDDWILCQITSNPYSDRMAVEIVQRDFMDGSLMRTSYARPGKLFSANTSLMERQVGTLKPPKLTGIVDAVVGILRPIPH
jgi:mRNA interferase MazF